MKGLKTVSVVEALSMTLRARVLDGQIDAGPGLTESDVAAKHDVSRPTAKTAISLLVHEGAAAPRGPQVGLRPQVVPQRRRGPLPRPYPPGVGGRPAREGQQAVLAAATRAVEDLAALPAGVAHSKFVVANRRFHHARVEAVDSPRLTRLYAGLRGEIHLSMVQTHYGVGRDRIVAEHRAILDVLDPAEPDAAEARMRSHLEGARDALAEQFDTITDRAAPA